MYKIDIKEALYPIQIALVVYKKFSKTSVFVDRKWPINVYRFFLHDIIFLHKVTKLKSSNLYNYLYQYISGFNTHYTILHLISSM